MLYISCNASVSRSYDTRLSLHVTSQDGFEMREIGLLPANLPIETREVAHEQSHLVEEGAGPVIHLAVTRARIRSGTGLPGSHAL